MEAKEKSRAEAATAVLVAAAMAGATALAVWAGSAWGSEAPMVQLVHVPDAQVASDSVILSEPEDWQAGGKLAIVMVVGPDRERLRARLVSDLLAAHVAVAELMASPHLADPTPLVADAYRTLQELARTAAPGRTMLYGFGWDVSGYAAIQAADPAANYALLGEGGPYFDAHASLGAGCRVSSTRWDEIENAKVAVIRQGQAIEAQEEVPDVALTEAALACGLALVPGGK